MVSAVIWTPRDCDQLIVAPDLRRAYRSTLAGMGVGMGFGGSTGSAAMRVLRQMSAIMRAEEAAGGAALLYLAPYWQINTGFTGGYQRVTTWNDAFRSGATYGWSTHTAHAIAQSAPSYAGNLATLTGGGASVLTFNNSTCRYVVGGTFSAKTDHSLFLIEDVQEVPSNTTFLLHDVTNTAAFRLGLPNISYWDGSTNVGSTYALATGQHMLGFVRRSASCNFYRDADSELVSTATTNKAFGSGLTLFNWSSGTYGCSSKRSLVVYCSGDHTELAPLVNALQPYLADLTVSAAVTILNQIKAICQAEEAAGGSCFLLLPGDWTVQQPILTLIDVLTDGVLPGVSYAGHTMRNGTQAVEVYEAWTKLLTTGTQAAQFGSVGGYPIAFKASVPSLTSAYVFNRTQRASTYAELLATGSQYLLLENSGDVLGWKGTGAQQNHTLASPTTGTHSCGWSVGASAGQVWLDGVSEATSTTDPLSMTNIYVGGAASLYGCVADLVLACACTGNYPQLYALARQYGQLVCGAP